MHLTRSRCLNPFEFEHLITVKHVLNSLTSMGRLEHTLRKLC